MSSYVLGHGPDGKFIGYGAALSAWLPELLSGTPSSSRVIQEALTVAAGWCQSQAAKSLQNAAAELESALVLDKWMAQSRRSEADKWLKRRDYLLTVAEEIKKI